MDEVKKQVGIDSTVLILETMLEIGTDISKALEDHKFSATEALAMVKHIPALLGMIKAAPQLPAELKDLDSDEREQIVAHFAAKFELTDRDAEARVELLFRSVIVLATEVVHVVETVKTFKAKT